MSEDCEFCRASKPPDRYNSLLTALHIIERYAVNVNGVVGSLYDAHIDNLLLTLPIEEKFILKKDVQEKPICKLEKIENSTSTNLLEIIHIQDELRLSITLGMVQVTEGILLLNSYELPMDRITRLIHYQYINQEECLSNDIRHIRDTFSSSLSNNNATHIITRVKQGVDFVIVLELNKNDNQNEIDCVLSKLCDYFITPKANFLSREDQQTINGLKLKIFTRIAEICSLANTKNFSDICQDIHRLIFEHKYNIPLFYELHTIQCIYYKDPFKEGIYYKLDSWNVRGIEQKIVPLFNKLKIIARLLFIEISPLLSKYLKSLIEKRCNQISEIKNMYKELQQSLATKVNQYRRGNYEQLLYTNQRDTEQSKSLHFELDTLHDALVELKAKASFIDKLKTDYQMEYLNVADLENQNDDQKMLEGKLFSLNQKQNNNYLCSSDELFNKFPYSHSVLCRTAFEEYENDSSLQLVFADFSYCSLKLNFMKLFNPSSQISTVPSRIKSNEINIVLIGETGVGKSTFINALVNYLVFHSLDDAKNGQPIVLIPVSFLVTIGDQFEERKINFGKSDPNENHNDLGQSVTQHCQSYVFHIDSHTKIRIIDTPGLGDTRGIEQDDKNIEHILQYINNFSHINAICFLLKPNSTRLHVLFRSCFTQLFNFLGPKSQDNIMFCFTNTRATFYTPGNTAPLLKNMLNELHVTCVPSFSKKNTFCFDSESFRYLAIIKTNTKEMIFDDNQEKDFDASWKFSVSESIRLLDFIRNRSTYQMNQFQSIKHAQMMITTLVRPIVEIMRNALRNLALRDIGNQKYAIEMNAQPVFELGSLCATCQCKSSKTIGNISIVPNSTHQYQSSKKCSICPCPIDEHIPILYTLEYKTNWLKGSRFHAETEKMKDRLLQASLILTHFLRHTNHISQNPFLPWFNLFIKEEVDVCSERTSNTFNLKLLASLETMKNNFIERLNYMIMDKEQTKLDYIYGCIDELQKYPMISEQMKAIKTSQIKIMKDHEHDVSSQHPHLKINGFLRVSTSRNS